jgi:hypothetical protein
MKKRENTVGYTDGRSMMLLKWKDRTEVMILSTFHKGEEEVKVEVNVSEAVDDYNKN